jgi:hypothetical protein
MEEKMCLCAELSIVPEVEVDVWEPTLARFDALGVMLMLNRAGDRGFECGIAPRGDLKL